MEENMDNNWGPVLHMAFETSFGDRTELTIDVEDETIGSVIDGFRRFLLACGYSSQLVEEYLPQNV